MITGLMNVKHSYAIQTNGIIRSCSKASIVSHVASQDIPDGAPCHGLALAAGLDSQDKVLYSAPP